MRKEKKLTQSEIDGVQYRRAKLWQIILYSCNAMVGNDGLFFNWYGKL